MYYRCNKNNIYYEINGQGQPIIFLHGFGGNHIIWNQQVEFFSKRGFKTITLDYPGHGKTTGPSAKTINELIDDICKFISDLNLNNCVLVGHSMGASVTWGLTERVDNNCFTINKIVTIDQSPKMLSNNEWKYGFCDYNIQNYLDRIANPIHIKETMNGLDQRVWKSLKEFKEKNPFDRNKNLALFEDHVKRDWRKTISKIDIPYMCVVALNSPYFDYNFIHDLKNLKRDINICVVKDTGHDIMAEKPDEFNSILNSFISNDTLDKEEEK